MKYKVKEVNFYSDNGRFIGTIFNQSTEWHVGSNGKVVAKGFKSLAEAKRFVEDNVQW